MKRYSVSVVCTVDAADENSAMYDALDNVGGDCEEARVVACEEVEPPGLDLLPKSWRSKLKARPGFLFHGSDQSHPRRFVQYEGAFWTSNRHVMLRLPRGTKPETFEKLDDGLFPIRPNAKKRRLVDGADPIGLTLVKGESDISRDYVGLVESIYGKDLVWRQTGALSHVVAWRGETPVAIVMPRKVRP